MNILKGFYKVAFSLLLAGLVLAGCKHKEGSHFDFYKYHKKHPESPVVKSLKTYVTNSDTAYPKASEILSSSNEFNAKGWKTKETHYTEDSGKMEYTTATKYDDNGNAIETHSVYPASNYESTEKNTYDKDKHLLSTDWTRTDGTSGRHEYKYDDHGKMIRWDWFEKGKFVVSRLYYYVYDKEDRPIECVCKETKNNKDTTTDCHETYAYDSVTGLQSGKIVLIENNVPLEIVESQYDSTGNKIIEIHYERDSVGKLIPDTRTINIFNEYGDVTQSVVYKGTTQQSTTENKYDQYGHLIESITKDATGIHKIRNVYEYY